MQLTFLSRCWELSGTVFPVNYSCTCAIVPVVIDTDPNMEIIIKHWDLHIPGLSCTLQMHLCIVHRVFTEGILVGFVAGIFLAMPVYAFANMH